VEGRPAFRQRPRWRRFEAHVAAHVELYLAAVTLCVVLLVPLALELGTDTQELAGAALVACVVQATLLWVLRRRATKIRQRLIAEVQALLRDRINNHLQIVVFSLAEQDAGAATAGERERLAQAMSAVAAVSRTLDELSTDSLRRWHDRYREALTGAASSFGTGAGSGTGASAAGKSRETCRTR
jgi:hypothetical protein